MSIFNSYVELLEGMCFMVTSQLLVAIIPDLCGQTPPGHFWLKQSLHASEAKPTQFLYQPLGKGHL